MIICPKCGKENQDHYKFCLGCGAELPRDLTAKVASAPSAPNLPVASSVTVAPPSHVIADPFAASGVTAPKASAYGPSSLGNLGPGPGPGGAVASAYGPVVPNAGGAPSAGTIASSASVARPGYGPPPAAATAVPPAVKRNEVSCPQCGQNNAPGVRFCMSCGFNLAASLQASVPPPPQAGAPTAMLTALRADKSEVGSFSFAGTVTIGRDTGGIFAGDSYLSPRHATFGLQGGTLRLKDESSLNGTFIKLMPEQPTALQAGDVFRIGQEIIRFEALMPQPPSPDGVERLGSPAKGYVGRIALIIGRDVSGNAFPVPETGINLGRERGDVLFPEDGYVSGLHCRIRSDSGRITLTDLGSSNGTFFRITSEHELHNGDEILMGQQIFRVAF